MSTATRISTSTATPSTRLTLTRRGRTVFTALAAIPIVAAAVAFALGGGVATATDAGSVGTTFDYVTIHAGQSLWQLAETVAPLADPRDVIADIVSLNRLAGETLQPGQRLAIPAGYESAVTWGW